MRGVKVEMLVDGKPVSKIRHNGETYLPVSEGDEFEIRISNDTHENIVAVVSVDGLSVMNGQPAKHDDSGYVVRAYRKQVIKGYRRGSENVAKFVVGRNNRLFKEDKTYAEKRTGSSENNGVIGVAIYPEFRAPIKRYFAPTAETKPWPRPQRNPSWKDTTKTCSAGNDASRDIYSQCEAGAEREEARQAGELSFDGEREQPTSRGIIDPGCFRGQGGPCGQSVNSSPRRLKSVAKSGSVGTKMGQETYSPVREVEFVQDYSRKSVVVLYYDTVESLKERGILRIQNNPNPFPAEPDYLYCPDE